eukprot:scaffold1088_cov247-Pinguiococcus_pyrenoidosus.AAC.12
MILATDFRVGDNPRSDMQGAYNARMAGRPWEGVLVRTGVYKGRTKYPRVYFSWCLGGYLSHPLVLTVSTFHRWRRDWACYRSRRIYCRSRGMDHSEELQGRKDQSFCK